MSVGDRMKSNDHSPKRSPGLVIRTLCLDTGSALEIDMALKEGSSRFDGMTHMGKLYRSSCKSSQI
ncbi:hypothetical protein ACYU03_20410 [Pseudomonas sp. X10]